MINGKKNTTFTDKFAKMLASLYQRQKDLKYLLIKPKT